jgi:hypothetical protein
VADPGQYDAPPIRPGAEPTLDTGAVRFTDEAGLQPTWIRMTSVLVRWIRHHFSAASRVEFPNLAGRVWTSDPDTTEIVITSLAEWNPRRSGNRPSVLVDRLDQSPDLSKRPIGPQWHGVRNEYYYTHFVNGQHVVHVLGGREGEAEFLAAELWRELIKFSPVVQKYLCLHRFQVLQLTKRQQLSDEHKEHYACSLPCFYYYEENWAVKPLSAREVTSITTILDGA